jgi:hypothetical protein
MTRKTNEIKLYTVVVVWRGFATGAKNFKRLGNARKYMRRIRRGRNLAEDDVQVFECPIRLSLQKSFTRLAHSRKQKRVSPAPSGVNVYR